MSGIQIRKADPKDSKKLLEIYSYYVEKTAVTFEWETPSEEEFSKRISKTLQKYPYLVAFEIDEKGIEKLIGYAYAGPFKERAAYDWAIETSIYVHKDYRKKGIGKMLLLKLEELLAAQNVLNANACIAFAEKEDEYLTNASVSFHQQMGYSLVGKFNSCGNKFYRWYSMVWMEKFLGEHTENPEPFIPFADLSFNQ